MAATPSEPLEQMSARELVRRVQQAMSRSDYPGRQQVFRTFVIRLRPFVLSVLARLPALRASGVELEDAAQMVFVDFFRHCLSFDPDRAPSDFECEVNLRTFLAQRARWVASACWRNRSRVPSEPMESDDIAATEAQEESVNRAALQLGQWLDSLPAREQDIFRAYFLDDHPGRKGDRLPASVVSALCRTYKVTPSNLRHIKLKLMKQARRLPLQ